MLKILADENFPLEAVVALQHEGYDVAWVRTDTPGSSDQQVLERAQVEERLILTFDKDFGELAFSRGLPATNGIILFRIQALSPDYVARVATLVLASRTDWAGHFSVVEDDRIRMTPLPNSGS